MHIIYATAGENQNWERIYAESEVINKVMINDVMILCFSVTFSNEFTNMISFVGWAKGSKWSSPAKVAWRFFGEKVLWTVFFSFESKEYVEYLLYKLQSICL